MNLILWIIIGILVGICFYFYKKSKKVEVLNSNVVNENKKISNLNVNLKNTNEKLKKEHEEIRNQLHLADMELEIIEKTKEIRQEQMTSMANTAFEGYCMTLDESYAEKEKEYDSLIQSLESVYSSKQEELRQQYLDEMSKLEVVRKTREAAVAAQLREKEIKEKLTFYCLNISTQDAYDIQTLNEIKPKLHNPRVLSMLIWSTFFQKDMNALCNRVLGANKKTGIYKITNQINDMCYIGQSVDVATRWKDHAKHGLGIDAPASNKLYTDMQEEGIWNFSWELLEECPREQLNEKERYYIDLYQSEKFGYNSTKGNK